MEMWGEPQKLEVQLGEEFGSIVFLASDVRVKPWVVRAGNPLKTPRRWKLAVGWGGIAGLICTSILTWYRSNRTFKTLHGERISTKKMTIL